MKKLYSVAAIAALALSANAQIYIVGSGVGLDWTPETPMEVALTDGNFRRGKPQPVQGIHHQGHLLG